MNDKTSEMEISELTPEKRQLFIANILRLIKKPAGVSDTNSSNAFDGFSDARLSRFQADLLETETLLTANRTPLLGALDTLKRVTGRARQTQIRNVRRLDI